MKAIDNAGLKTFCHSCEVAGFAPAVTYSLNTGTKVLTLVDTTTYPAGDDRGAVNFTVSDRSGNVKTAQMAGADVDDTITIDLSADFVVSDGFVIQAMVVSNNRLIADLTAYDVYKGGGAAAGSLGYLDTNN